MNFDGTWMKVIESFSGKIIGVCIQVAALLLMIRILWGVAKAMFSGQPQDFVSIAGYLLTAVAIGFYKELMQVFSLAVEGIAESIPKAGDITVTLDKLADRNANQDKVMFDMMTHQTGFSGGIIKWLISSLMDGLTLVIRTVLEYLRAILLSFVYVTGPFAIVFSLIPGFSGVLQKWFSTWLNIQCWAITLNMLDAIVEAYGNYGTQSYETSSDLFLVTNLAIIVIYLMVPWLTSLYTGASGAGRFLSQAVLYTTAATKLFASGGTSAAASGVSAGGGASSAAASALSGGTGGSNGSSNNQSPSPAPSGSRGLGTAATVNI